jgi:hypothetical protein
VPTFISRGAPVRYYAIAAECRRFSLEAATLTYAGTGGARKVRFAGRGKGKSGGYRVITFYAAYDIPVFLLDVYSKDAQANLSQAQRNELRKTLTALPRAWREQKRANAVKHRRRT